MCAHSRRLFVRVDFSFLKSSRRQAPLAANTARHRQHGAPTRHGGAVDWLHPWWCKAPLKLKKSLYDRVWWVETSTACKQPSASMWHGTLVEVVEQAYVSACRCVATRACNRMPSCYGGLLERAPYLYRAATYGGLLFGLTPQGGLLRQRATPAWVHRFPFPLREHS